MRKGLFITVEGLDGAGKSTQLKFIEKYFKNRNLDTVFLREPGGTLVGEKIREILLDRENTSMKETTEAFLYAAARAQLVSEIILPSLMEGKVVVCDRYIDSTLAYQGFGREMGLEKVLEINKWAIDGVIPDLTILLSLDNKNSMSRVENSSLKDRIEMESLEFHTRVRLGYETIKDMFKDRIKEIEANKSIEEISNIIKNELDLLLRANKYEI